MTFLNYFDQITLDPDQDNEVAAWFGLDKNASYGYIRHKVTGQVFIALNTGVTDREKVPGLTDRHGLWGIIHHDGTFILVVHIDFLDTPPIAPELLEPLYHYAVKYCIDLSNHFDQHKISLS